MANLLIVDPDPRARDFAREILEYDSHRVCEAQDWMSMVAHLLRDRFEVVVLDPTAPGIDRVLLTRFLGRRTTPTPRVVLWSAVDEPALRRLAAATGAEAWLVKGPDAQALAHVVDQMVADEAEDARMPAARVDSHPGPGGPRDRTALVADPDREARRLARRRLEAAGWRVREAADRRSLEAALRHGCDLVILDPVSPDLSLGSTLRAVELAGDDPQVVVWSDLPATSLRRRCQLRGAEFVAKASGTLALVRASLQLARGALGADPTSEAPVLAGAPSGAPSTDHGPDALTEME